nr:zinc ribbon domain-containing protein [Paenibacillus larvae]
MEVNPAYTSQTCPTCAEKNKAKDRGYECSCGFNAHRDRVGDQYHESNLWQMVTVCQPKMLYVLS